MEWELTTQEKTKTNHRILDGKTAGRFSLKDPHLHSSGDVDGRRRLDISGYS
jgi:hypothetical protein